MSSDERPTIALLRRSSRPISAAPSRWMYTKYLRSAAYVGESPAFTPPAPGSESAASAASVSFSCACSCAETSSAAPSAYARRLSTMLRPATSTTRYATCSRRHAQISRGSSRMVRAGLDDERAWRRSRTSPTCGPAPGGGNGRVCRRRATGRSGLSSLSLMLTSPSPRRRSKESPEELRPQRRCSSTCSVRAAA